MGWSDLLIAAGLLGFAGYTLYRSIWKKKGHCHGCDCSGGGCAPAANGRGRPPGTKGR